MFRTPLLVSFVMAAALCIAELQASDTLPASDSRAQNVREFLTLEGTFDLAASRRLDWEGSLDLSGVSVQLDPVVGIRALDTSRSQRKDSLPEPDDARTNEAPSQGTGSWWEGFALEVNSPIKALAVYQGDLYIGGVFTEAGGVAVSKIARWDGTSWHPVGSGLNNDVSALAVFQGDLIAAGSFTQASGVPANRIARWNGTSWSALGTGLNGSAISAAVYQDELVVSGSFTAAGGTSTNRIAAWSGAAWTPLGLGLNSWATCLEIHGTNLYAGGGFTQAGGMLANRVARWDGSSWHAVSSGFDGIVNALESWGGQLYAGGAFSTAGGTIVNHIARWNGIQWQALEIEGEIGFGHHVKHLGQYDGELIVSADFYVREAAAFNIAAFDGVAWKSLGPGLHSEGPMVEHESQLFVGCGDVSDPGTSINRWNGFEWQSIGPSLNNWVLTIEPYAGGYAVGGLFSSADLEPASSIALWSDGTWTQLGSGVDGAVYCSAVFNGDLVVGGYFTSAGGQPANYVARWDGSAWHALGSGTNGMVRALEVHGGSLYAGGTFTSAGGVTANHVARWNGSAWSQLGAGIDGVVHSLHSSGATLVVGGKFGQAGGGTAQNLAAWNGSSWSQYGGGVNGPVFALSSFAGSVVVGGFFTQAGVQAVSNLAAWNGTTWSSLGGGVNHVVRALGSTADHLIAGGFFSGIGQTGGNFVAAWNGTAWNSFSEGPWNEVRAISATSTQLWIGGLFRRVDGISSPYLARWDGPFPEVGGSEPAEAGPSPSDSPISAVVDSANVTLVSYFPIIDYNPWVTDLWGYADASGEYALVCQGNALTVIDVTDPTDPVLASKVPSVGVDLKDVMTYGTHAYCINQLGPIQVIDLSDPYDARTVGLFGDPEGQHNCYIDTDRGLLLVAPHPSHRGLEIFDLTADPIDPPFIGRFGFLDVHDIHIRDGLLLTCNSNGGVYELVDMTDPLAPVLIRRFTHDRPSWAHSGWLAPDLSHMYTCDETAGGHLISWDITDPSSPVITDDYELGTDDVIHNVYMEGDRLYVSYYGHGLRVLDASDPAHPVEIGHWDSDAFGPDDSNYHGCYAVYPFAPSGLVYFTAMAGQSSGLYVVRVNDGPTSVETGNDVRLDLAAWPNPTSGRVFLQPTLSGEQIAGSPNRHHMGSIRILNSAGRLVRRLGLETLNSLDPLEWDGRDARGHGVPSGRYFLSWTAEGRRITRSITVTR